MPGAQFGEMDRWLAPLKDRQANAKGAANSTPFVREFRTGTRFGAPQGIQGARLAVFLRSFQPDRCMRLVSSYVENREPSSVRLATNGRLKGVLALAGFLKRRAWPRSR